MEILIAVLIVAVVALAPLLGADSRDGRDWQARADWEPAESLRRRRAGAGRGRAVVSKGGVA